MDASRNTRRQSVADYPKPESDLAEWTSKIKAMQRQVDADEEAEQKRLEEEIAAARQARLRRSSRGARSTDGVELARAAEKLNLGGSPNDTSSYDRPKDAKERYGHQNDALRKIMGQNHVYVPESRGTKRSEGVSLASFIGGTATGPRLNKHAAQQDAHDPTQFSQPDTSAPHPIFGRGGVAMPGMASKGSIGRASARSTTPSQDNRKAISDLKAVASALGNASRTPDDTAKSSYLRQPDEERRKATSPTPIAGSEAAERYRPSTSPSPGSTLRAQKSFDRSQNRTYGTEESERYRPSVSPTPSGLRTQKSFDRSSNRSYGTEDRRPSPSPTPKSTLRAQKSFDRSSGQDPGERYRSTQSPSLQSNQRSERPVTPQKTGSAYTLSNAAKSTPDLRKQKSWTRADDRPVTSQKTGDRDRGSSLRSKSPAPSRPASRGSRADERPVSSQKTGERGRGNSFGSKSSVSTATRGTSVSASASAWSPSPSHTPNYLASTSAKPSSTGRERTTSTPNFLPKGPVAIAPVARSPVIAPASLAKPIQPEPRTPSHAPKISTSAAPSPAFQKAALPKEVTPSISRLQGRGFVQNMVKTSLTLESSSAPSSTTSTPAEKPRLPPAKKGSVLDRWQPHMQNQQPTSPVSPPAKSTFSVSSRKFPASVEPQSASGRSQSLAPSYLKTSKSSPAEEPLSPRSTARMMEKMGAGGGSATTMFVERPMVDELGVKRPPSRGANAQGRPTESASSHHSRTSELPASTGKPLIHVR